MEEAEEWITDGSLKSFEILDAEKMYVYYVKYKISKGKMLNLLISV
jgi:hypothetical protein